MAPIGTGVIRREVEFIPAKYEVTEYIATTYECPQCKQTEDPQFIKDEGCPPGLYLMADGFQGYDKLKNVKRCACYAHI